MLARTLELAKQRLEPQRKKSGSGGLALLKIRRLIGARGAREYRIKGLALLRREH
jgi:hypothetical protein